MKKVFIIVFMAMMAIVSANCQEYDPKSEYHHLLDSALDLTMQDSHLALKMTEEMAAKYGWNSDLYFIKGLCCIQSKLFVIAEPCFEAGIKEWKKDDYFRIGAFYKTLTALYTTDGRMDDALKTISKGIKRDKSYLNLYMQRGNIYSELSKYKKAIADYKKASADEDMFCDAMAQVAVCYASMHKMEEGKKAVEESLKQNKYHGESRRLKALFELTDYNIEGFIDNYLMYMQISMPLSPDHIYDFLEDKDYYKYEMDYAKSILESKSDSIEIAYWEYIISTMESHIDKDDEMWAHAQRAREMNPGNALLDTKIWQQYAIHYDANDELDSLVVALDTLIARDNDNNYKLNSTRGDVLRKLKRYEEAIASYEKALEMGIDNLDDKEWIFYRMANIYHKELKDADKTIACYDSILVIEPQATSTMYQIAKIYIQMKNDTAEANKIYNKIIEKEKGIKYDYTNAYSQFAFAQLGRYAEAEAFQKKIDEFTEEANELMKGVMYYNAACLYSIIGKEDLAIEKLMSAIDEGIGTCETLTNDDDFNNIRENYSFKAILKMLCTAEEEEK